MLRQGGELNGVRLVSQAMIQQATQNHTGDRLNDLYDYAREMYDWQPFPAYMGMHFFPRGEGVHLTQFGINASASTFGSICMGAGGRI